MIRNVFFNWIHLSKPIKLYCLYQNRMKQLLFVITNYIGCLTFLLYKCKRKTSLLGELFYGQMIKHGFASPLPKILFAVKPIKLIGGNYIRIGNMVKIGQLTTLSAWVFDDSNKESRIVIGNNVTIGSFDHITAVNSIQIEDGVLLGKYVTITDNSHGEVSDKEIDINPLKRALFSKGAVIIEKNVWIGDKVTILPNVRIGKGTIVGANSVVTKDLPPYVVACGNPAKVIKKLK